MSLKTIIILFSILLILPFSFGQVPNYVPTNELVGWWGFNGNANDESGNGNNGTVNGATLTNDRFGNPNSAYEFNNDNIDVGKDNSLTNLSSFTISLWVNIDSKKGHGHGLFGSNHNDRSFLFNISSVDNFQFPVTNSSSTSWDGYEQSTSEISDGKWHHLVGVFTPNQIKIYIDLNNETNSGGVIPSSVRVTNQNIVIGTWKNAPSYSNYYLEGKLDDIGIWNRALTQCEISALYHGQQLSAPVLSFSDTTAACGTTTTLDAGTDPSYSDYLWSTSDLSQTLVVTSSGEYSVQVTDTNGCVGYDTTYVSLIDPTIDQVDTTICLGDSLVLSIPSATGTSCSNLPTNLQNGLVGYWPFCGNANDESGNGNDGTVNGATLTTDRFGNANSAYDFDGVNDYIEVLNSTDFDLNKEFTIQLWINGDEVTGSSTSTEGSNLIPLISKWYSTGSPVNSYLLSIQSTSLVGRFAQLGSSSDISTTVTPNGLQIGKWYSVSFIKDNNTIRLYIDGVEVSSNIIGDISIQNSSNNLFFGNWFYHLNNTYKTFNGRLDDISIYDRALSTSEIQQLHDLGSYDFTWSTGETNSSITVHPTTTTTYSVSVSDGVSSCSDDVTVNVGNVVVDLGQDTLSACGNSATLDAGIDPSYSDYLWSTSDISQTLDITSSGEYSVQVTDTNGCVGYDTTYVSLIDPTIDQIDTTICLGDSLVLSVPTSSHSGASCFNLPADLQTDLVGYWPFCGNANDESGNGNDGTVSGATLTTDRFGNANSAYDFDGNDWIVFDELSEIDNSNQLAVSLWVKTSGTNSNTNCSVGCSQNYFIRGGDGSHGFRIATGQGSSPRFYGGVNGTFAGGVNTANPSVTSIPHASWNHILLNYDGVEVKLYINGNFVNSVAYTDNIGVGTSTHPAVIGRQFISGFPYYTVGKVDDVGIWKRALTECEIQQLYTGSNSVLWSTGETCPSITVYPTTTTTYSVTVSDGISSCSDDVTITVNNPQIDAGLDTNVCNGDNITLNGSGGNTYSWTGGIIDGVAFTPSASGYFYVTGTDTDGCEGTDSVYVNLKQPTTGDDIQTACDTYTWIDGNTYTSSTNSPTFVLTNAQGCDSTVTLDLTINYSNAATETVVECSSYTWPTNGQTYTQSGLYTENITNQYGCDSSVTLDLTINQPSSGVYVQTACDTYTWIDGNTYTSSTNTPTFVLTNAQGCDSTVTLNLTITSSNTGIETIVECSSYTWPTDGQTYSQSGQYTAILTNALGCDSTVTLDLTINQPSTGVDVQTACDTYIWIDGNTYTSSTNTPTFVLANAQGCDSTVTLDLTINYSNAATETVVECSSYTWSANGQTYTQSGQYTAILTNQYGCDSTVTLDLTINQPTTGVDAQTACDTYTWIDGNTYTSSTNIPTHVLTNALGCDSVVTLDLTINNFTNLSYTIPSLICEGDSIRLLANGGVDYQWDNGVTNGAFVKPTLGINTYQVQGTDDNGCIASSTIQVEVATNPEVTFITQPAKCQGYNDGLIEAVVINGQLPYSYDWDNGGTDYIISELRAGAYILTVTDANFCSVSEKVDLDEVDINCLNVSSGLSPNGDGINDVWVVNGLDIYPDAEIKVLNRWGAVVYNYQEEKQFWDGTYKGKDLPSADYYYIIKVPGTNIKMNGVIPLKR